MIKIVASNYIKQESVNDFLAVAEEMIKKTNANDKGCISYALYRDTRDPLHFTMIEEWEDEEAINGHMQAPHFVELIPVMDGFASKPGELTTYVKAVG